MDVPPLSAEKLRWLQTDSIYSIMQLFLSNETNISLRLNQPPTREHFWVIGLRANYGFFFADRISLESVYGDSIKAMDVFSMALQKGAPHIILCHNRPTGNLTPSSEDEDVTNRFYQIGRIIGITVLDHHIIASHDYYSFLKTGLLEHLKQSTKYVPQYELIEEIQAQAKKIMKKGSPEARASLELLQWDLDHAHAKINQLVKRLHQENDHLPDLVKISGLSVAQIEAL